MCHRRRAVADPACRSGRAHLPLSPPLRLKPPLSTSARFLSAARTALAISSSPAARTVRHCRLEQGTIISPLQTFAPATNRSPAGCGVDAAGFALGASLRPLNRAVDQISDGARAFFEKFPRWLSRLGDASSRLYGRHRGIAGGERVFNIPVYRGPRTCS